MRFPAIVLTCSTQFFFCFCFCFLARAVQPFQRMRILVFELPVKQSVTKGWLRIHVCLKEMKISIVIHDRTARTLRVQTDAKAPNIVAPTMLRVSGVWKRMQQLPTKQHATACNRVCKRTQRVTSNNVASVCTGLYLNKSVDTLKLHAKGRNIVGCYTLRPFAHPVACCCFLLHKVWNRSNF